MVRLQTGYTLLSSKCFFVNFDTEHWGSWSSVCRDLAREPEGGRFNSSLDHITNCGLVAGVPVHLWVCGSPVTVDLSTNVCL